MAIYKRTPNGAYGVEPSVIEGLKKDPKPTDCANASKFYEFDTQILYKFNGETKEWIPQNKKM